MPASETGSARRKARPPNNLFRSLEPSRASLDDVFGVVRAESSNPAVLGEVLELRDRLLGARLVETGLEVDVEDVIAQSLAARPRLDASQVDIPIRERFEQLEQQARVVRVRIDHQR